VHNVPVKNSGRFQECSNLNKVSTSNRTHVKLVVESVVAVCLFLQFSIIQDNHEPEGFHMFLIKDRQ